MALQFTSKTMKPNDFFGKLFQIRDQVHLTHLAVKGPGAHAAHTALNDYYEEILELTDTLIESYQGKYGVMELSIPSSTKMDAISLLKSLVILTDGGSVYNMFTETWIQNQLDEISTLTYHTIYKLENLK